MSLIMLNIIFFCSLSNIPFFLLLKVIMFKDCNQLKFKIYKGIDSDYLKIRNNIPVKNNVTLFKIS
mgnify:CR=1 FL=1